MQLAAYLRIVYSSYNDGAMATSTQTVNELNNCLLLTVTATCAHVCMYIY